MVGPWGIWGERVPLLPPKPHQIRIDKLVDKWSGSIEIGVTAHNPNSLEYPATMTNLRSGGCPPLTNTPTPTQLINEPPN